MRHKRSQMTVVHTVGNSFSEQLCEHEMTGTAIPPPNSGGIRMGWGIGPCASELAPFGKFQHPPLVDSTGLTGDMYSPRPPRRSQPVRLDFFS